MSKVKAHTIYRNLDGKRAPGTTTITNSQLGWKTEALKNWANRIGLEGIDASKYTDDKADIGTLAHEMVTRWLMAESPPATDDYTKNQIDAAENSALSFHEWAKGKRLQPIFVEKPLTSEIHRFGGTSDIYAIVNDAYELIDLKTGSGIYDDMFVQVAAYEHLLIEFGYQVDVVRILNIPRSEDERFIEQVLGKQQREVAWEIFLNCLANYQLRKKLNGR